MKERNVRTVHGVQVVKGIDMLLLWFNPFSSIRNPTFLGRFPRKYLGSSLISAN